MRLIKNLPNLLTLFNLFLGCMAIVYLFNDHMVIVDAKSNMLIDMGQADLAAYCIFLAAVIDFFDGFVARLLKVESELGKQLDSLADMVTFGLVPGIIMYELIARSYYASYDAFDYPILYFAAGFLVTLFGAWRLARFNIDETQKTVFRGLPIPSMALIIASLPLIIIKDEAGMADLLNNKWILFLIVILLSYLMVSRIPMLSLKMKSLRFDENQWLFGLMLLSLIAILLCVFVFHFVFIVIPVVITLYILLSIIKNIAENGI